MAAIQKELTPISQRVYAEVWGDTVDLKHLAWAIGIGTGASVLGFYCAIQCLVTIIESEQWAYAYAMLAGLAGCIVAGTMGVKAIFSKRLVTDTAMSADLQWRRDVMAARGTAGSCWGHEKSA